MRRQPISQTKVAAAFTTVSVLVTILWQALPAAVPGLRWSIWVWFFCSGAVLLSLARFSIRHPVPLPEVWLLSFPFLFEIFFQRIYPTTRIASVDELLWCVDAGFGYPQLPLGKLLLWAPILLWICKLIWWSLPLQMVVVYLAVPEFVRRKYLAAVACTGCMIMPLYALCPGAGPAYLFQLRDHYPYPWSVPIPLLHPHSTFLPAGLQLNTTPSGHITWALLFFWFCLNYSRKRVTVAVGAIAVLTVIATLGLGEHYVIDLILSVPFAAAVWALVEKQWKRAGVLMAILIAWLVGLREGWVIPMPVPVVWLLCGVTMLVSSPWHGFLPEARGKTRSVRDFEAVEPKTI
jgi:PAP2 superfamily protein